MEVPEPWGKSSRASIARRDLNYKQDGVALHQESPGRVTERGCVLNDDAEGKQGSCQERGSALVAEVPTSERTKQLGKHATRAFEGNQEDAGGEGTVRVLVRGPLTGGKPGGRAAGGGRETDTQRHRDRESETETDRGRAPTGGARADTLGEGG